MKAVLSLMICAMALISAVVQAGQRPNVLLLMAEDMSSRVGAFGDAVAVTPNLDQFAAQGVRYDQAFTTAGVCAPSRAAIITGMHQIAFGGQHMRTSGRPAGAYKAVPNPEVKAFPELLRAVGYYTFTDHKLDYQFSTPFTGSGPFTIWDEESSDADWDQRAEGQPFFGYYNFNVTHESGTFSPLGNWPNNVMHFAMQLLRAWNGHEVLETPVTPEQIQLEPYYPDTPLVRTDIARHYNNIVQMDQEVGDILARLEADGLLENTIVIWTTDHGDGLPRAKRELYDSGIRVPLIIRWPEQYRPEGVEPGEVDHRLVSLIDLAPTILALAGVAKPDYVQGVAIAPQSVERQYIYASRDRIDAVDDRRRAVRDHQFKYIRSWYPDQATGHYLEFRDSQAMTREMWRMYEQGELDPVQQLWFEATGPEQLFDLQNDPFELVNLASAPQYAQRLAQMRQALDDWLAAVDDWSEEPEEQMVQRFMPGGEAPVTEPPSIAMANGAVAISCASEGASVGYRLNGGPWQLYRQPLQVESNSLVEAKAIRYGWEESRISAFMAP